MKEIKLDNRLSAVVELLGTSKVIVDVGCDHGYVPNYLIENKKSKLIYATDISKESLRKTIEYSLERNNYDKIISIMGDGLSPIEGLHFDSVIIAGMGGDLIIEIIQRALEKLTDKVLILQPMTVVPKVREFLYENNFLIEAEKVVYESGKYYEIIRTIKVEGEVVKPERLDFSKVLIDSCDPSLLEYIERLCVEVEVIISDLERHSTEKSKIRRDELVKEMEVYKEILNGCKC